MTLPVPPANLSSVPILVVEDNATNRRVLHRMLSSWGMKPALAENGEVAKLMLQQSVEAKCPYQFILIDSQMPGQVEGYMVAEFIKQSPHFAKSTAIMLTSTAQRERGVGETQNNNCAVSLTKPVGHTELLNVLVQPNITNQPSVKPTTQPKSQPSEPYSGAHILLAEDNTVNQKLAIRLLERFGYKVTLAENGLQAVAAAERQQFDLVLMDVQMPEMGGFEATAIIRDRELLQNRHTPIVAMTAHALQGDREKCLEARMDDYLSKPIRADQLKSMIEKFLNAEGGDGAKPSVKPATSSPAQTTTTTTTTMQTATSSRNPTGLDPALLSEVLSPLPFPSVFPKIILIPIACRLHRTSCSRTHSS
jgi:two-component system sensor histidine kinase/response regulator